MSEKEFRNILENVKSGTAFKARVIQRDQEQYLEGVLHVDNSCFYLCYNGAHCGDIARDLHGYSKSWKIYYSNLSCIISIEVDTPVKDVVNNTYSIY